MFRRLAALVAAGVLATAGLATSTAHASAPFTDTVRISGNFDNGEHGYWARPTYNRTVTITPAGENMWNVALRDAGTFTTIPGAKSPQAGVTLGRSVSGTFSGTFDYTVRSDAKPSDALVKRAYNFACDATVPNRGACPGMPKTTSEWPTLYFPAGAVVNAGAWRWEYRTCAERWVNSSAGNSGDITGERCDRAVRADAPSVVQPECGADRGKLTVPADRGVSYEVRAGHIKRAWRAGEYPVRPGTYWVTATARDGYKLVGDRVWKLVVNESEPCPTPTPSVSPSPTTEPTTTPDPNPETPVATPTAPTLEQATCTTSARVTIPEAEGVVYKNASGKVLEQGKYSAQPGSVTVTAEAADGYTLADGATTSWTLVVSEAPDCPTATPTSTQRVVVVNNIPVPSRVDTGFGGLAR